ncbi:MAG: MoaF N-terminal domain-containing protein [Firmicutes bacterium]|nr:MoaF N-terminal domain-containing protein [Bacillota bacterium]
MHIFERLNGKKLEVSYEGGAHYRMTYLSDNQLRWEALHELSDGEAPQGTEPYAALEVTDGIYNVNWVEEDGMTASQILNFHTNKVSVFLTFADEKARGGRDHVLLQGKFRIAD